MQNIDWHLETHELLNQNIQIGLGIIGIIACLMILHRIFTKGITFTKA